MTEETGLIIPIGEWVLRQACADAARWPTDIHVAVNLSSVQFKSTNLVGAVSNALSEAMLGADHLELEITETVLLNDSARTLTMLHELRTLGVELRSLTAAEYHPGKPFDQIRDLLSSCAAALGMSCPRTAGPLAAIPSLLTAAIRSSASAWFENRSASAACGGKFLTCPSERTS